MSQDRCTGSARVVQVYCIEFNVHSTKSVVFRNMITAVLHCGTPFPPPDLSLYKNVYTIYRNCVACQNMITAVLLWQPGLNSILIVEKQVSDTYYTAKFDSGHSYLCTISSGVSGLLWSFYEHTVTVLISRVFSSLTAAYQYRRGVSFMISPACTSHLLTETVTSQRRRIYFALTCRPNPNKCDQKGT